jgi:hypothetical protein
MFGIKMEIKFTDLKEIVYKEGALLDRFRFGGYNSRYHLLLETYNDPTVSISQFKKETDAK